MSKILRSTQKKGGFLAKWDGQFMRLITTKQSTFYAVLIPTQRQETPEYTVTKPTLLTGKIHRWLIYPLSFDIEGYDHPALIDRVWKPLTMDELSASQATWWFLHVAKRECTFVSIHSSLYSWDKWKLAFCSYNHDEWVTVREHLSLRCYMSCVVHRILSESLSVRKWILLWFPAHCGSPPGVNDGLHTELHC